MNLSDFKVQNPAYKDVPDDTLADALHAKYYSDIPKDDFYKQVGIATTPPAAESNGDGTQYDAMGNVTGSATPNSGADSGQKSLLQSARAVPGELIKGAGGFMNKAAQAVNKVGFAVPVGLDKIASMATGSDTDQFKSWWVDHMITPLTQNESDFTPDEKARMPERIANSLGSTSQMLASVILSAPEAISMAPQALAELTATKILGTSASHAARAAIIPGLTDAADVMQKVYDKTGDVEKTSTAGAAAYLTTTGSFMVPGSAEGSLLGRVAKVAPAMTVAGEASRVAMNQILPDDMQSQFNPEHVGESLITNSLFGIAGHPADHTAEANEVARATYSPPTDATNGSESPVNDQPIIHQRVTPADVLNAPDLDSAIKTAQASVNDALRSIRPVDQASEGPMQKAIREAQERQAQQPEVTNDQGNPPPQTLEGTQQTVPDNADQSVGIKTLPAAPIPAADGESVPVRPIDTATENPSAVAQEPPAVAPDETVAHEATGGEPAAGGTVPEPVQKTPESIQAAPDVIKEPPKADASERAYTKIQAQAYANRMTRQNLPSEVVPHPTEAGKFAIVPRGQEKAGETAVVPSGLTVAMGGKSFPVDSFQDAGLKYRDAIREVQQRRADGDETAAVPFGGQLLPVSDGSGKVVAYAAANGRVYPASDIKDNSSVKRGAAPSLFDPYVGMSPQEGAHPENMLVDPSGWKPTPRKVNPEARVLNTPVSQVTDKTLAQTAKTRGPAGVVAKEEIARREQGKETPSTLPSTPDKESQQDGGEKYQASRNAAPTFYSHLSRSVESAPTKIDNGPATQWKLWIQSNANKLGIKKDEIEWSGLNDWLDAKGKDKVSKAEITDYLKNNGVQVQEVTLGGVHERNLSTAEEARLQRLLGTENRSRSESDELRDLEYRSGMPTATKTKFASYQLPGGENYRELLLTLPQKETLRDPEVLAKRKVIFDEYQSAIDAAHAATDKALLDGDRATYEREYKRASDLIDERDAKAAKEAGEFTSSSFEPVKFRSSHYDQPNILAHVRFNERTDAEGKRVLFLEEIQSDYAQRGRKVGFRVTPQREAELKAKIAEIEKIGKDAMPAQKQEWVAAMNELQPETNGSKPPAAPFVGKTEAWTALALKRMIRYAAENGFDRVAWTTGEQQSARYDLSKQIQSISHEQNADGTYHVVAKGKDGSVVLDDNLSESKLEDTIGKEVAKKITKGEGEEQSNSGNSAWRAATKPESIGKLGKDIFGAEMASLMPLDHMDAGVLSVLKHDQVRQSVISFLPVDVVDILASHKLTPEDVFSNPHMVVSGLPIDSRTRVIDGIASAMSKTGATIRAELKGFEAAGSDVNLLPALKTSDLSTREIAGLLDDKRLFHGGTRPGQEASLASARAGAESLPPQSGGGGANNRTAAELARLLNAHGKIISHEGMLKQEITPPTSVISGDGLKIESQGMKGYYDKIVPSVANDVLKKLGGGKVGLLGRRSGVTKPNNTVEQVEDFFGRGQLSSEALNAVVDSGMVPALQNDKIFKAVVEAIPVNVMDVLTDKGVTPEQLARDPKMFLLKLPIDSRLTVANGFADALTKIGAALRARLDAAYKARFNAKLLPTLNARDINTDIAAGIAFPHSSDIGLATSRGDGGMGLSATGSRTEPRPRAFGFGENTPAEFAKFVDWHKSIVPDSGSDVDLSGNQSFDITDAMREKVLGEGQSLFRQSPATQFSDRYKENEDAIVSRLVAIADRIVPKTNVDIVDQLFRSVKEGSQEVSGSHNAAENLIKVSLRTDAPENTLRHESIHALKAMGMFTKLEWMALEARAKQWHNEYDIENRYGHLSEEAQREEAIAEGYAHFQPETKSLVGRAFAKVGQFLSRLGNMLRGMGFNTAESVFAKVESGEVGNREPTETGQQGEKNSLADRTAFERWFGNSKVVDAEGKPLVVYHGTNRDFNEFKESKHWGNTHFFTADGEFAEKIANGVVERDNGGGEARVIKAYVSIKNPVELPYRDATPTAIDKALNREGHDGVIVRHENGEITTVVARRSEQIKSVTGNNGSYDPTNPDIRYSVARTKEEESPEAKSLASKVKDRMKSIMDSDLVREFKMSLIPMSTGTMDAKASAQKFANDMRKAQYQWQKIDTFLGMRFNKNARKSMWAAADEQNTLMQQGLATEGKGIDRLPPDQRAAMETLHLYANSLWERAKAAGMVTGEGMPFWTPRMAVMVGEDGAFERPGGNGKQATSSGEGRNVMTTASSLKQRKYLTSEETEAGMKGALGENAALVRDIRTMPLAMARMESAIAGRELVNQIKALGQVSGKDLISESMKPNFVTIDHPAFTTYATKESWVKVSERELLDKNYMVRDDEIVRPDPKQIAGYLPVKGYRVAEDGGIERRDTVFERHPLFISKEWEGPLKSVMSNKDGLIYSAYMLLKSKAMTANMVSPLSHNMVIAGRALAYDPAAVLSLKAYFVGNRLAHDDALMNRFISAGLVPMGANRNSAMDITDIARGIGKAGSWGDPNESWINLGAQKMGNLFKDGAGDTMKDAMDKFGDFYHNDLLWKQVGALQVYICNDFSNYLVSKGISREAADPVAAHLANRYGGAVARENQSEILRKALNVMLFSRSFNTGNIGAVKDTAFGLPAGLEAKLYADVGKEMGDRAMAAAKSKARLGIVADLGMSMLMTSITASAIGYLVLNQTPEDIKNGYIRRLNSMLGNIKDHPMSPSSYNPYQVLPTWDNETGKQDRIDIGADEGGRHEYLRLPTGKVVEDTIGWLMHSPDTFANKLAPMVKSGWQAATNDKGYGVPVEDPDGNVLQHIAEGLEHVLKAQINYDSMRTLYDVTSGKGTPLDKKKMVGTMTGFTTSQGNPHGPEAAEVYAVEDRMKAAKAYAMEGVKRDLKQGDEDAARTKLENVGLTQREINTIIRNIESPKEGVSRQQNRKFNSHATEEEKAKRESLR